MDYTSIWEQFIDFVKSNTGNLKVGTNLRLIEYNLDYKDLVEWVSSEDFLCELPIALPPWEFNVDENIIIKKEVTLEYTSEKVNIIDHGENVLWDSLDSIFIFNSGYIRSEMWISNKNGFIGIAKKSNKFFFPKKQVFSFTISEDSMISIDD